MKCKWMNDAQLLQHVCLKSAGFQLKANQWSELVGMRPHNLQQHPNLFFLKQKPGCMQKCGGSSFTLLHFPDDNSLVTQAKTLRYCLALKSSSEAVKENVKAVQRQTLCNRHNEKACEAPDSRRRTATEEGNVCARLAPPDQNDRREAERCGWRLNFFFQSRRKQNPHSSPHQ